MPGNLLKFLCALVLLLCGLGYAIGKYHYGFTHAAEERDRVLGRQNVETDEPSDGSSDIDPESHGPSQKSSAIRAQIERLRRE